MKPLKLSSLVMAGLLSGSPAQADLYDVPKVETVQNRLYFLNNELTLNLSYLPLDPYVKYFGIGGSYTLHFSNFTAWEIVNGSYLLPFSTGLKKNLNTLGKPPPKEGQTHSEGDSYDDQLFTMKYFASTNLKFTPLYTKNLLFNSKIVHSMVSFVGGVGIASFERDDKKENRIRPFINMGLILQYMLSEGALLKFDFRDQIYTNADTRNNLTLTLGIALNFGGGGDKIEEEFEDEF